VVSLAQLQTLQLSGDTVPLQYRCCQNLNLYDSLDLYRLTTQAEIGRHLVILALPSSAERAIAVRLCEDDYPGWLAVSDLKHLEVALVGYQPNTLTTAEIRLRLPEAIAFAVAAMHQPNEYLWGGTVAPNYDCSGLVQAAFRSIGVWLPRDAYQQESFVPPISIADLRPGDLIFFGNPNKATHVAIYLGDDRYIHSSGKDQGRNGIGVDALSASDDPVSQRYRAQLRGAGRVIAPYQPSKTA
jgi:cell wall-associated NlpC family hydrolase